MGQQAEKTFAEADANHDGKLTRTEWKARFGNDNMFDK